MDAIEILMDWIAGTSSDLPAPTPTDPSTGLAGLIAPWAVLP